MGVDTAATERLPWLADELPPAGRSRSVSRWGVAAAALVAAAGAWIGLRSVQRSAVPADTHAQPTMTVRLPPARAARTPDREMAAEENVAREPEARQAAPAATAGSTPLGGAAPVPRGKSGASEGTLISRPRHEEIAVTPKPVKPTRPNSAERALQHHRSEAPVSKSIRFVQVGAFGSERQAKHGWRSLVRAYPPIARLPAAVRRTRNSKGRAFYRFEVRTTSLAHSEVLCRRMENIHVSCAVTGDTHRAKMKR